MEELQKKLLSSHKEIEEIKERMEKVGEGVEERMEEGRVLGGKRKVVGNKRRFWDGEGEFGRVKGEVVGSSVKVIEKEILKA